MVIHRPNSATTHAINNRNSRIINQGIPHTVSGAVSNNYDISYAGATLTIN